MSSLTFGPPVILDGPLPAAPPHCLLNVPGVIVDEPSDRWLNGATVYAYPVDEPSTWDPCSSGTFRTKVDEETPPPLAVFGAFVVYLPIQCSSLGMRDPDEFRDRGRAALEAVESFAVEQVLSQGSPVPAANPFFCDANADILASGAAVSPAAGLSYLEDAIGATGRGGMIHATPGVVSQWFDQEMVGTLTTALGTPVAAGGGYIGAQPAGEAAAVAGQAWAFATGPVQVRHAEASVFDISEVLDRSDNTVVYRAERYVLASWDTALQAAVLIDWTP